VYCSPALELQKLVSSQNPDIYWKATCTFTSRPLGDDSQTAFDNPLSQPPRLSGSYSKLTKQAYIDKDDKPVMSSSKEQYNWEVDDNRPTVSISLTLATLPVATYSQMVDTVNSSTMWGLPPRCIKLSNIKKLFQNLN
jgi:hypothetical protein